MAHLVRSLGWALTLEEYMTQLNLSGRQLNDTQQKPVEKSHEDESIKNQTVGALGALAMFAAVIVIGSCSRSTKPVAVQQPVQPTTPASAPAPTMPALVPVPTPVVAKAKSHRAATLSYINREYGISFIFPRNYQLKTQLANTNEAQLASVSTEAAQTKFAYPGGLALASVEMPAKSYPGTDFKAGFIRVSVNHGMTAETCTHSALPAPNQSDGTEEPSPAKTARLEIGGVEFVEIGDEMQDSTGAASKQPDAKYYHAFSNGACYEFALGIATDGEPSGNVEEVTPVNREAVFARLEKILASVRFQPVVMPETQKPATAVATTTPADSSSAAEHHEGTAPNF
jgi:hypothetical protein